MVLGKSMNDSHVSNRGYVELPIVNPQAARSRPSRRTSAHRPSSGREFELPGTAENANNTAEADAQERARLIERMELSGWVQAKAARMLGLTPRQMGYALRKHGIDVKRF
jgi:Nif-specific regulatory protein